VAPSRTPRGFVDLAESIFDLRPVQRRPPVYLAAYTPAGLARIARRADGWTPTGVPIPAVAGSQVEADIERCAEIGVDEVCIDVQFSPDVVGPEQYLDHLERFAALIPQARAA
jgi:alkanesulfonate monooxygenase SsuD/methylene tetrahydromethanopterin reductase-like flavin-dependent oxidoreductase (luciferase family)